MKREEHKEEHKESLRASSISIGHSVKTTINSYQDMKGHLSEYYDEFVANPLSFGVDAETAHVIQNMNSLQAKGLWVLFKKQFKLKLEQLEQHDLAELLNQDLAEDGVTVASKEALKMILKNPGKAEFHLEPEMILAIQSLNSHQKEDLMKETASLYHIELGESAGHKILAFLKGLWTKLAPVLEKIFGALIEHGIDKLGDAMGTKLPSDISESIKESISDIGHETVKITTKTVSGLIEDGLNGESVLVTLKESVASLSLTVVKEVGEAAEHSAGGVMGIVGAQLGVSLVNPLAASSNGIHDDTVSVSALGSSVIHEDHHG
jgi:hypothetical protein